MSLSRLVGVAAALACAGMAAGAAVKIKEFDPSGSGVPLNPRADGVLHIKTSIDPVTLEDVSHVHLHMEDLQPNQTYFWALYDVPYIPGTVPAVVFAAAEHQLHTNSGGAGTIDFDLRNADLSTTTAVMLFQWTPPNLPPEDDHYFDTLFDEVTSSEARALGTIAP